ncbi:MAG: lamin tail domain-containing protein [Flavobacteriales bacterium]
MRLTHTLIPLFCAAANAGAQMVINEVDYDQPSIDTHEFIEFKNNGANAVDPASLRLIMISGAGGVASVYRDLNPLTGALIMPGEHFVICADPLATANCDMDASPDVDLIQNGATDALVLVHMPDSTILDVFSYEGDCPANFETMGFAGGDAFAGGVGGPAEFRSLNRFPDGTDTGNNSVDFIDACTTPGGPNAADTLNCGPLGLRPAASPALPFRAFLDDQLIWMHCAWTGTAGVRFDVFSADGSLIASRTVAGTNQTSWALPLEGLRGRLLLLRASSADQVAVQRIVVP